MSDDVRLVAEEARAAAEKAARTAARLQRAAEALSVAVTPAQVLDAVLTEGVAAAEARAGLIALLTEDGDSLEVVAERGYRSGLMETWSTFPVSGPYPLSEAVRTGEPVFIGSERERLQRYPGLGNPDGNTHGLVCLPLVVEGRTIGGLAFSFGSDQEFDADRRALKVALARQAAQALDRARLYEALQAAEAHVAFLAQASELLASSLDYEQTLDQLAKLAVPRLADWCTVDVLEADSSIKRLAVAHVDPEKVAFGWELHRRFPPEPDEARGAPKVVRTGEPEFLPEIPQGMLDEAVVRNPGLQAVLDKLGLRSWICVPLKAHGQVHGALSLVMADSARRFGRADFELAVAVAERAGVAIENALLYQEAERRGDAARALTYVGDGVILVDGSDVVRYWNRAAAILCGGGDTDAVGRPVAEVVPGWPQLAERVTPVDAATGELAVSITVPVAIGGEERWLSAVAVDFGEGRVYALRDVTHERRLEQARSDFVTTASHELRTPLAAVYGAVRTLRRDDVTLDAEKVRLFLEMIESETERLNAIVSQILVAGELDGDTLHLTAQRCDVRRIADGVLAAARLRAPTSIELELRAPDDLPPVLADEDKLRQVLVNLVENAIKYSPDGGDVTVELSAHDSRVRIDVRDQGLGVPHADHERIFEKFVRLDPGLSRGVGGSGLGLYITRELTERMGGTIGVDSAAGAGSRFTVTLPTGSA